MSTNLTFTATADGMEVTGDLDLGYVSVPIERDKYQLIQKTATKLWLRPTEGAWDIKEFGYSDVVAPATANLAALKAVLTTMLSNTSNMGSPIGIIYVSSIHGSVGGSGSIDDPISTIGAGVSAARTNASTDGVPWGVHVLGGTYDAQIGPSADRIYIRLCAGASIQYTGSGAAIQDDGSGDSLWVEMEEGSLVATDTTGNPAIDVTTGAVTITGNGSFEARDAGDLITVSGGALWLEDSLVLNTDPVAGALLNISGGSARLFGCHCASTDASSPFLISGGATLNLDGVRINTAHTDYISAAAPENVQIADCVSNVAAGANITETVGTMLVNAGYTL